jgi:hypothetical protein
MIDPDHVWPLLLNALRDQDSLPTGGTYRRVHGKVHALCQVLALDPSNDVTYHEPDKVLLEARARLAVEARR